MGLTTENCRKINVKERMEAEAFWLMEDFSQTTSGKSIPTILNRKRKLPAKTFMSENQENTPHVSRNVTHAVVYGNVSESPMRSRSPLHPLEFNFPNRPSLPSGSPKTENGLHLRESWKRFRDAIEKTDEDQPSKHKIAKKSPNDLWHPFVSKNRKAYQREKSNVLLSKHPTYTSRMRTILLDWLIEVCEVYRLHRETFYLSADFFDRYMSRTMNIPKTKLQLIGVTCLFIAAKIEEIYPPKLQEFAYVTDGACAEDDILTMELVVLKQLNWSLSPKTPNAWSKLLLQIDGRKNAISAENNDKDNTINNQSVHSLIKPSYCGLTHSKIMHLVDLCMLDINCLNFSYSSLAASASYFVQESPLPPELDHEEVGRCISWMTPYAQAVNATGYPQIRSSSSTEDQSNYQSHSVDIKLLELAHSTAEMLRENDPMMIF